MWVWPESSPEAWIESAAQQPAYHPLVKDLDPGSYLLSHILLCHSVLSALAQLNTHQQFLSDAPPLHTMSDALYCLHQLRYLPAVGAARNEASSCAEKVGLTTNQNYIRDFPVAYDILFENISDQVCHPGKLYSHPLVLLSCLSHGHFSEAYSVHVENYQ